MEGQKKKQYRGFPIKDFGNDKKGVTPEWFYEGSMVLKTFGFPIKNFGNDGGGKP